eukprot:6083-Alexandrium_andersonii.AAC.1
MFGIAHLNNPTTLCYLIQIGQIGATASTSPLHRSTHSCSRMFGPSHSGSSPLDAVQAHAMAPQAWPISLAVKQLWWA